MSNIDERIVAMKFNNKDFEKNATISMKTLDTLKQKLDFSSIQSELNEIKFDSLKRELNKIGDIDTSKFEKTFDRLEYRMSNLGLFTARIVENIADDVFGLVKNVLSKISSITSFVENGIVSGGYRRASNIQAAKFQLEGLGIAWKDIESDIDFAVKNTAYSLDAAAKIASQLVAAGLKPGTDYVPYNQQKSKNYVSDIDTMAMVLRSISGVAAMTNSTYEDIGDIFMKMISYGKVYAVETNQLSSRGLNVKAVVADYLNSIKYNGKSKWTVADVTELMSDKKGSGLNPMILIEAMYERFGEHAVKANETLSGVTANINAALARIGANFIEPIIENKGPLVTALEVVRRSFNDLNAAISPVVRLMGGDVARILSGFTSMFMEKNYIRDEEGHIVLDELTEEPMYEWVWKKKGGLFSTWLEPWKKAQKNYIDTSGWSDYEKGKLLHDENGFYELQEYESRAAKLLSNIRTIFNNIGSIINSIIQNIGNAFSKTFPAYKGFADLLVRITNVIADFTTKVAESPFFRIPKFREDEGLFAIIRGLWSGLDVIYRFGKSFKKHILDPIFNKAVAAMPNSVGNKIIEMFNSITEFDNYLKEHDDYFGPFFENIKHAVITAWEFINPYLIKIKDAIAGFIEPYKNILMDDSIPLIDRLKKVKDLFKEDVAIPAWEKIKDVFSSLKDSASGFYDALSKIVKSIKDFFGIQEEYKGDPFSSTKRKLGGTGGQYIFGSLDYVTMSDLGLDMTYLAKNFNTAAGEADEGATKTKSAWDKIKEVFSSINLSGSAIPITILAVLTGVVVALIYVFKLIISIPIMLRNSLPEIEGLFTTLINRFSGLLLNLGKKFKMEGVAAILESVGKSLLMIVGAMSLFVLISKIADVHELERAFLVISLFVAELFGISVALLKFGTGVTSNLKLTSEGLSLSSAASSLKALASLILVIAGGAILLSGMAVLLGTYVDEETFDTGLKMMQTAFAQLLKWPTIIAGILAVIIWISGLVSETSAINYTAIAAALGSISAVLTSITVSIIALSVVATLIGLIPRKVFRHGYERMLQIVKMIAFLMLGISVFGIIFGNMGTWKQIASSILSASVLITSIAISLLIVVGAMKMLHDTDLTIGDGFAAIMMVSSLIAALAGVLMVVKYIAATPAPVMSAVAGILALTIAFSVMAATFKTIASLDSDAFIQGMWFLVSTIAVITISLGVLAKAFSSFNDVLSIVAGLLSLTVAFTIIGTVIALILSSGVNPKDFLIVAASFLVMFGGLGAIAVVLDLFNDWIHNKDSFKDLKSKSSELINIAKALGYMALGMLAISAAMALLVAVKSATNTIMSEIWGLYAFFVATLGALVVISELIMWFNGKFSITGPVKIASIGAGMILLSLSLVPIAAAIGALMAIANTYSFDNKTLFTMFIGIAAIAAGLGLASEQIINSMHSNSVGDLVKWFGFLATGILALIATAQVIIYLSENVPSDFDGTVKTLIAVFVSLGVLATYIVAMVKVMHGIDWMEAIASAGSLLLASVSLSLVSQALTKLANYTWDQMLISFISMAATIGVLGVVIYALSTLASTGLGAGGVLVAAGAILAMGAAVLMAGAAMELGGQGMLKFAEAIEKLQGVDIASVASSMGKGLVAGFVAWITELKTELPGILTDISQIVSTVLIWIGNEIITHGKEIKDDLIALFVTLASIATDPTIRSALWSIIKSMLEFVNEHAGELIYNLAMIGKNAIDGFLSAWYGTGVVNKLYAGNWQAASAAASATGKSMSLYINKWNIEPGHGLKESFNELLTSALEEIRDVTDPNGPQAQLWHQIKQNIMKNLFGFNTDEVKIYISKEWATLLIWMRKLGAASTEGLSDGAKDKDNSKGFLETLVDVALAGVEATRQTLGVNSPSKVFYDIGASCIEGLTDGVGDNTPSVFESGESMANSFIDGYNSVANSTKLDTVGYSGNTAAETAQREGEKAAKANQKGFLSEFGVDIGSITGIMKENYEKKRGDKLVNVGDYIGWDKGIQGNIDGIKRAWSDVKSVFTGDDGQVDISWLFENVKESLPEMESLLGKLGLDLSEFENLTGGVGSMGTSINTDDWMSDFEGFDINDYVSNSTMNIDFSFDDSEITALMNNGTALDMVSMLNVQANGMTPSNSYVTNNSFTQNNYSPTALTPRETNRLAERESSRRYFR